VPRGTFFIIFYFLPFGLALVAPVVDFFAAGAAFLAVAFVAILVKCISPSQRSGTFSTKKNSNLLLTVLHYMKFWRQFVQFINTNLLLFLFILNKFN
jgi:hypothetical protein